MSNKRGWWLAEIYREWTGGTSHCKCPLLRKRTWFNAKLESWLSVESFSALKPEDWPLSSTGEESLTIFLDKQKLNKKSEGNSNSSVVSLELLHQLAASYFTDRESTLRRLHHLQIATSAIKVPSKRMRAGCQIFSTSWDPYLLSSSAGKCPFHI